MCCRMHRHRSALHLKFYPRYLNRPRFWWYACSTMTKKSPLFDQRRQRYSSCWKQWAQGTCNFQRTTARRNMLFQNWDVRWEVQCIVWWSFRAWTRRGLLLDLSVALRVIIWFDCFLVLKQHIVLHADRITYWPQSLKPGWELMLVHSNWRS